MMSQHQPIHARRGAEPLRTQPYHYTLCGLDNVYLSNGYDFEETDYGRALFVRDADALHKAIGLHIVHHRKVLLPKEVRFLRKQLDLTQAELGGLMGQSSQQVARWEKGQSEIPGPADRLLRFIFLLRIVKEQERDAIGLLEELDRIDAPAEDEPAVFKSSDGGWRESACL